MRSSASTRSPPTDRRVRLLLLLGDEDNPRACTGRRLVRRGDARAIDAGAPRRDRPVVLDPHAARPLSSADLPTVRKGGLLAVDCSWNRLAAGGALPLPALIGPRRRLPLLIAANPHHFGRVNELNTAEALAAGVYVLGDPAHAATLLGGFRGGTGFLEVNRERLDRYRHARDPDEVLAAERALFGG